MKQLIDTIGNTPLVELQRISPRKSVRIYAKLEGNNPGGSVKDRAAFGLISGALERGTITQDTQLIEATSGNTGIALAMIARQLGVRIELVMPENATRERVQTMRAYGASVTLTPADGGMEASIDYVREKVRTENCVMLDQFGNPDNPAQHYKTTGPEIYRDTKGKVTHFVSAMGTTGTIMGVSRYLKEQNSAIHIIGAQPGEGASIPGIRKWPEAYRPAIYEPDRVDRLIDVTEDEARMMSRRLASEEGIFAGMSSGGAVAVALKVAQELQSGLIVCVICDRGDKYLSTDLFV